jgi:hypothetical protein
MTREIDFPPELDARLREEAACQGQEAADYVHNLVKRELVMRGLEALKHGKPPQPLADLKPLILLHPARAG